MFKVYRVEEFEAECLHPTPINLSTAWIETAETAEIIGWPASPVITFNEALVIKKVLITMLDPSACEMYLGSGPTIEQKMMCGHIMDGETRITAVFKLINSNIIQNLLPMNLRKSFYQKKFGKVVFSIFSFIGR